MPFIFLAPIIEAIPSIATAPILVLVGIMMAYNIRRLQITHFEEVIAVALTIIMMPLCFSITAGAVYGIISFVVFKLCLGKYKEISPHLAIVAIICSGWFFIS